MKRIIYVIKRFKDKIILLLDEYTLLKNNKGITLGNHVLVSCTDRIHLGVGTEVSHGVKINCGKKQNGGQFSCGTSCFIGPNTIIYAGGGIKMGNSVLISPSVNLISHQHQYSNRDLDYKDQTSLFDIIEIGNNVWIGSNATILPGVKIGDNAIIGANALVNKNVIANSIVAGVPAKTIKHI
ncbi:MAG: acyltransferase [Cyclobacteriaceae bacterium]|nr:acyltransferase [Cyclobacteriaceae bacterium]